MTDEEKKILAAIRASNEQAFEQLFRQYHKELFYFANRYLKRPGLSEELVQDCFAQLWDKRDTLRIHTSIKAFLYTNVKNRTLNLLKSTEFKTQALEQAEDIEEESIENQIIRAELAPILAAAIDQLPEKCRHIFILSKQNGLSYAEIAQQLNISEKTVENQIGIAYKKLRVLLKDLFTIIAFYFF